MTFSNDGKQVHLHDTDGVDQGGRSFTDWIDVEKTDTLEDASDLHGEGKHFKNQSGDRDPKLVHEH